MNRRHFLKGALGGLVAAAVLPLVGRASATPLPEAVPALPPAATGPDWTCPRDGAAMEPDIFRMLVRCPACGLALEAATRRPVSTTPTVWINTRPVTTTNSTTVRIGWWDGSTWAETEAT